MGASVSIGKGSAGTATATVSTVETRTTMQSTPSSRARSGRTEGSSWRTLWEGRLTWAIWTATVTAKDESWNKFRQFCKTVMCHRRVTARAWEEARRRTSVTTSTRNNEGKNVEQRKTAEGDQPSILTGRHVQ